MELVSTDGALDLSIIVISYNTRKMTLECLRSVIDQTRETSYEVIVVDNNSQDGSAKAIEEAFPEVRLFAEKVNHGFAGGNNLAVERSKGRYVLLLNPDTVVLNGAVDKLMAFAAERSDAKIWGGRTVYADGNLNPTNCWRKMNLWTLFCRTMGFERLFPNSHIFNAEGYGGWNRDSEREVDIVTGCFFLIERDFWNCLGGFDLSFVMYGEEADLCLRARGLGARPRITPDAEIVHYVGASSTVRSRKHIMLLKAKVTLVRRTFPAWQRPLGIAMLKLWPASRLVLAAVLAAVSRQPRWREARDGWQEVWSSRSEWQGGYPRHAADALAPVQTDGSRIG